MKSRRERFAFYGFAVSMGLWGMGWSTKLFGLTIGASAVCFFLLLLAAGRMRQLRWGLAPIGSAIVIVSALQLIVRPNTETLVYMLSFIAALTGYWIVINRITDIADLGKLITVALFTAAAAVTVLIVLDLWVWRLPYLTPNLDKVQGSKNCLGLFLSMFFPFALSRFAFQKNVRNAFLVAVLGFAQLYVVSRGALICLILSFFLFPILFWRVRAYSKISVTALVFFLFLNLAFGVGIRTFMQLKLKADALSPSPTSRYNFDTAFISAREQRVTLLINGFNDWKAHPFLGIGVGNFAKRHGTEAHNDYIRMMSELGLPGLVSLIAILAVSARTVFSKVRRVSHWVAHGAAVSFLCLTFSLGVATFFSSIPVWFILGCITILGGVRRHV